MKCPYCNSPGLPRDNEIYVGQANRRWLCVKCPSPVSYETDDKQIAIWAMYNNVWFSIVYLPNKKEYVVQKEFLELQANLERGREGYIYRGENAVLIPSEENVTPANAAEKLALWLTFS